jgi:SurA-like protein
MAETDTLDAVDAAPDDDEHGEERAPRRTVNWWAVAAIVVVVVVLAVTIGGGLLTRSNATAATVNGHQISQSSFTDLLNAYRNNPAIASQLTDGQGHVTAEATARLLQGVVFAELVRAELDHRNVSVSAGDIALARKSLTDNNPKNVIDGFPKSFIDEQSRRSAEVVALQKALGDTDGSKLQAWLVSALRKADVSIDPRYGTFDARAPNGQAIAPPRAPAVRDERTGSPSTPTTSALGG